MADVNSTQLRDALAWVTDDQKKAQEPSTNPFVWFWEAMQGDFNEERSTGQLMTDAAISMIPLVDQVCDVRDLIANCNKLRKDTSDTWAWVALALTLIGLFPTLGSLVKGVLKIFFHFIRRMGGDATIKAIDAAMTLVVGFLRRRDVQKYLRQLKVDEVFKWLANEIKIVRGKVNVSSLLRAFDRGIGALEQLAAKVAWVPNIGAKAKHYLEEVHNIRRLADKHLGEALRPVQNAMDSIIMRLERESLERQRGIINLNNIHYRGALPEAEAVKLMRETEPPPSWLSKGKDQEYPGLVPSESKLYVDEKVAEGWPALLPHNVKSFNTLIADEIRGPARLYRILSPNSRAMSDCWVTEDVFKQLQAAADPRAAWRKHLAVWPDWNVNGQFVIYDIKPGESLKVWRGKASTQFKDSLTDRHLEGGWEQIVFNVPRNDARNDTMLYYPRHGDASQKLQNALSTAEYGKLDAAQRENYVGLRESINHPNISGPFDTGWGYSDFGGAGLGEKIGLPSLPGQTTKLNH
ncbi:hypothetical protein [Herbaspirillum sp. C9C3]|uniref:hypothetical protein n=1 Tax=Herbaspirillum sp. C9C3 TaxID=2735271 RepID=UPI0015850A7C|nr:hypothetical protein [Herbaspirillum sp. C9C3]NUT63281.1 hypothetical protein [Herbaspirillum sp. C9C3]